MIDRFRFASMALVLAILTCAASAQDYPGKPITLIVPFAAGGGTDAMARIVAEHMSLTLRQPVLVENLVGAGGIIGSRRAARAAPDGYTIVMAGLGSHVAGMGLYLEPGYDPLKDFESVSLVAYLPLFLAVKKSFPANTFSEFAALLKADPGKYTYGSAGIGSSAHLACLYLESLLGVKVAHAPFLGAGPAMTALLGEHLDYTCDAAGPIVSHVKTGAVKALVIAGRNRMLALPNMPTAAEVGIPKFVVYGWNMIMAPKGVPVPVADKLQAAVLAAIRDPAVAKRIVDSGAEIALPEERGQKAGNEFLQAELDRWLPLMKAAGVKPQ